MYLLYNVLTMKYVYSKLTHVQHTNTS